MTASLWLTAGVTLIVVLLSWIVGEAYGGWYRAGIMLAAIVLCFVAYLRTANKAGVA